MPSLIEILPVFNLLLGFLLASLTLAFLMRIVLTWYPKVKIKEGIWIILSLPTEPVLSFTRKFVSPIGGVDITPVIWVGITSLCRELLVGQQGLLNQIVIRSQGLA